MCRKICGKKKNSRCGSYGTQETNWYQVVLYPPAPAEMIVEQINVCKIGTTQMVEIPATASPLFLECARFQHFVCNIGTKCVSSIWCSYFQSLCYCVQSSPLCCMFVVCCHICCTQRPRCPVLLQAT